MGDRIRDVPGEDPVEICRHEILVVACGICRHEHEPPVWITAGGMKYHSTPDCIALREGQAEVLHRLGDPAAVEQVVRGSAKLDGRGPCRTCVGRRGVGPGEPRR